MKKALSWFKDNTQKFGIVFLTPFAIGIAVALLGILGGLSLGQLIGLVIVTGVCYAGMDYMVKTNPGVVEKLKDYKLSAKYVFPYYERYGKLFLMITAIYLGLLIMWIGPFTLGHIVCIAIFTCAILLVFYVLCA